ncbi:LEA type 2 family protein [Algibacter pectinivorans]|uniref:Late embryogenesis abundant protein n=1 Tax=Algibacter pectinivorans TaxID=870482 RepID=A0A1I1R3W2_9FLAO|nr:LEA type 2 family protein [Algibacter pectinivorans]SFD29074.1 Late embryogenesis abundant protein [Algibacter pectinivorans]
MKNLIILSTICFLFLNCSVNEKPQFIGLEDIQISESTSKYITFTAEARFINPNDIGGELQTDEIKVFINNNEMATVSTEKFEVPAKNEFSIPLKTKVPTDSIFSDKNLSGLLGSLFSKKVKVQYKGEIKYKVLGFSHYYNVDETEDVKIKF